MKSNDIPRQRSEPNLAVKVTEESAHILVLPLYVAGVFAAAGLVALVVILILLYALIY